MDIQWIYERFLEGKQKFTTDSRKVTEGCMFFALKGENFDGNAYALQALESGAFLAVVDDASIEHNKCVLVQDVLQTMQALATHHRRHLTCPVIGIAGSNGKTTTKELAVSIFSEAYKVHATRGNFNNHIGVPITLLEAPLDTEIALVEIGTNNFGEVKFLSELAEPDFGIITNIGKEHLEGFGSIEGVAKEESELYQYLLNNNGLAFVNKEDLYLNRMSHRLPRVYSFAIQEDADFNLEVNETIPYVEGNIGSVYYKAQIGGYHNAMNITAASAMAKYFGLSDQQIATGISNYSPSNNRAEVRTIGSNTFILDAYNANPSSMMAAIESFEALDKPSKIMLLGDMFELGHHAAAEHDNVLEGALRVTSSRSYFAGENFSKCCEARDLPCFKNVDELINWLKSQNITDTWFLVKGSRGMQMERITEAFQEN
jgi:UDP-N-acetylmuramoyl-tripeptide--D-alanyl-D-alanine ligase